MRLPTLSENTKLHITSDCSPLARRFTSNYNGKMTVIKRWPHEPRRNKCKRYQSPGQCMDYEYYCVITTALFCYLKYMLALHTINQTLLLTPGPRQYN